MSIVEFLSQPLWQRLGLTLVHFLWQGLAVAALVGAFIRVFRLNHGNARYAAYLLAFAAMIACPAVTFTAIDIGISPNTGVVTEAESTQVIDSSPYTALPAGDILPEAEIPISAIPASADSIPLSQRISGWLNVSMPWVLVIWMVGVIVLSVRLLMGFIGVSRWRRNLEPLPERLARRIASLSDRLGMEGFSRVFISPSILQAMAVGYLRPMVLLPAAMVTQMQPEMLEAVIAHELAHIRRFDLWVNLTQRVTETLLFYHPAVWWLSNCLRNERELCCDALAVKVTGRRLTYAQTLESVGRAGFMAKQPVLAAGLGHDNKPTLHRVRHILGLTPAQRNSPFWLAGVIAVVFLAAIVIPTTLALTNQSDEKLTDYENAVVEGIGANRDKFECGYLAWSNKRIDTRYEGPRGDLSGQYELWWDGKKMTTKYVEDQVHKDPEGHYSVETQQGGNSYDGGVLSRKPEFRSGNWLGRTGWRGPGSQDWMIRLYRKHENISKDWSVVDSNGAKLIRFTTRVINQTDREYGAYRIRDYDPSKGYGLVNEESYNSDGSPRMKHTVKIQEVMPGGWFPVEVDFKSFAITDGHMFSHRHYALDIERCSFNDKSAMPSRIFKGAIDKQLKYQEKLQKYLAMELKGLSRVKEIDKADKVKRGAREAIEIFITAAMAGDLEQAAEYAHPNRLPAGQIADLTEIAKGQNLWIMAVLADDSSAIAVSSVIRADHERIGPLVFLLDRAPQDGRDNWWVHDIDMETPDSAEGELKRFLEEHPKAKKVPSEQKPDVQVEGEQTIEGSFLGAAKARIINFPRDRSLGRVYICGQDGQEEQRHAQGEISVPPGKFVKLTMSSVTSSNISWLASLGPHDIQELDIHSLNLKDADLKYLKGLTDLRSLSLGGIGCVLPPYCPVSGEGLSNLSGMVSLRELDLAWTDVCDENLIHLRTLRSLEKLTLHDNRKITDDGLVFLKELPSLRNLSLYKTPVASAGLRHLRNLPLLEGLNLQYTDVNDDGLAYLQELPKLKSLALPPGITDEGLAKLKGLMLLEELSFGYTNMITDTGLAHLKDMKSLRSLKIYSNKITGEGLVYLRDLQNLAKLTLSSETVNDTGLANLKGMPVIRLSLGSAVSDAGLVHIAGLDSLETLELYKTNITDVGMIHLAGLRSLERLTLSHTNITDEGMIHLAGLESLKSLRLEKTSIGDNGLRHLQELVSLETLSLANTNVSDTGLDYLKKLNRLRSLDLRNTRVTAEGLTTIKKTLSRCYVFGGQLPEITEPDVGRDASIRPRVNPAVQVEGGKEALGAEKLVLKLVDNSGKPVAGAKAGTNVRTRDSQVLNSKLAWWLYSKEEDVSDEDGKIVLTRDKLFPEGWAAGRKQALYILNEDRQIGAFCEISKDDQRHKIELTLEPVCHVHGKVSSKDLEKIGRPLKQTHIELYFNRDSHGVLNCTTEKHQFDFWVPPGEYELCAYGGGDGARTEHVRPTIDVNAGQSELDLGVVDLPATKISSLIGKPAPEIGPIKAWKNGSPVTLAELTGKAVIICFGGTSPSTSRDLPKLVELHEQFADEGLVVIALYNCPSMQALEDNWAEVYKKYGGVQNVPFRVAVDGGESTFYEWTDKERLGATYGIYDITVSPTMILVDPAGKIVGELNLYKAKEVVEKMLSVKPHVSSWRREFDEVYRLEDSEVIRRIAPPFSPVRRDYYVNEESDQASAISSSPDRFIFHWDGTLKKWGLGFIRKSTLSSILNSILRLKSFEYDGPKELLDIELPGDWIIRDEVSQETKLRALEQLIARELGRHIKFEKRTIERDVIVAAGHFKFRPPSETYENKSVHLYADKLDPDEGSGGGTADSVNDFLLRLGSRVDMPVVDHTEPSNIKVPYRHHRSSYLGRIKDNAEKSRKLDTLLINLTRQTELHFRIERRPVEVWFATEQKNTNEPITVSK